ncbi:MAG: sigma 54-interacting transcriptional regulator [Deltaproteobacteria bacterium]|nr:sigma 54-interacting transcriptional regulator [Deltaproteobacteria bacterium]
MSDWHDGARKVAVAARSTRSGSAVRPVLYQLGRVGDRFTVGDGPLDLNAAPRPLTFGRREDAGTSAKADKSRVAVDDPWMSVRHARIVEGTRAPTHSGAGVRLFIEDLGSKNGVVVNGAASPRVPLLHTDIVETGRTFWAFVEERGTEPLLTSPVELGAMATWHPRLGQQLLDLQAASASDHVLVTGPDGAGKGFLARTLHQVSRRDGRFLHLDCMERRPRKIVVDVFGAEGGPQGKLRDAGAGTLLLENVDALPPDLQERLAEALRRRSFIPDGKTRPVALDMRLVATVSRSAGDANVLSGVRPSMREVLTQRVDLPPLAERACDYGLLLDDFLSRAKGAPAIARDACRVLFRHRFPQHVRGFARVVEAAASLAVEDDRRGKSGTIELRHLPFCVAGADAMRGLLAQAQSLAMDDDVELTGEVPILSATGDDGQAIFDPISDGFSSVIETDTEHPRPVLSSTPARRPSTASAMESDQQIWAEVEDVDNEALVAALRKAHGNVSAAARALGRPRALVLRWLRDLNLDPLSYR